MPKVSAASVALTALLALALTGCAGTPESAGDASTAPVVSTSAPDTVAPLVAETAEPEELSADEADATFIEITRDRLPSNTQIPNATDEQLIAAGHAFCEVLEDPDVVRETISVIEGEQDSAGYYRDSGAIGYAAIKAYCPDKARY